MICFFRAGFKSDGDRQNRIIIVVKLPVDADGKQIARIGTLILWSRK